MQWNHLLVTNRNVFPVTYIAVTLCKAELMLTGCLVERALKLQSTIVHPTSFSFLLETPAALLFTSTYSHCKRRPHLQDWPGEPNPCFNVAIKQSHTVGFFFFFLSCAIMQPCQRPHAISLWKLFSVYYTNIVI